MEEQYIKIMSPTFKAAIFLTAFSIGPAGAAFAQTGMGVGTNNPAEKLDVNGAIKIGNTGSTNAGTIRWTGTQFEGYDGTQWIIFGGGTTGWTLTGNTGTTPGTNFIGTTDNVGLRIKTNNTDRISIEAAGNVGIGTTTPLAKLHVTGNTRIVTSSSDIRGVEIIPSSPGAEGSGRIYFREETDDLHGMSIGFNGGNSGNEILNWPANSFNISGHQNNATGSVWMTILRNNGNVGISTTAPADKLHVVGSIRMVDGNQGANKVMVSNANGTGTWTNASTVVSANAWALTGNSGTTPGTNFIGTTDNVDLRFRTNNTDKVTIKADGNVGIGNTNPSQKLEISDGRISVSTGLNASNVFVGRNAGVASTNAAFLNTAVGVDALAAITTSGDNTALGFRNMWALTTGGSNSSIGSYALSSLTTGGSNVALGYGALNLLVDGSNNVAIGRAAGSGNTNGSGNVFIGFRAGDGSSGSNELYIDNSNTSSPLIYGNFSTNIVNVNGNLGVNTATPGHRLDVAGNARFQGGIIHVWSNSATEGGQINLADGGNNADGQTNAWSIDAFNNDFRIMDDGTTRVFLQDDGNMGVGTTTPNSLLHLKVNNTGFNTPLILHNNSGSTTNNAVGIAFGNEPNNVFKAAIVHQRNAGWGIGDMHFILDNVSDNTNADLSDARMTITRAGNVGIGTTNPLNILHVAGSLRMVDGNQGANKVMRSDANGTATWVDPNTLIANDGDWTVSGNNQYSAVSGNVGIGTSVPAEKFAMAGGNMLLAGTSSSAAGIQLYPRTSASNSGGRIYFREDNNDLFGFSVGYNGGNTGNEILNWPGNSFNISRHGNNANGNVVLHISGAELVGIGTTSPASKLDVNGTFNASGGGTFGNNVEVTGNYYLDNTSGTGSNNPPFRIDGFSDKLYLIAENNGTGPATGTEIRFRTASTTAAAVDRMVINKDGNMGIGGTNPQSLLQVQTGATGLNIPLHVKNTQGLDTGGTATGIGFSNESNATAPAKSAIVHERTANWGRGNLHFLMASGANHTPLDFTDAKMTLTYGGNLGLGTSTPADKLEVQGSIRMVDGNQAAGYIPVSDANGKMTWTNPSTIVSSTPNKIVDADNDTKVQVEESSDEDIIRFDMAGTEYFTMRNGRLNVLNTGRSVFIGENAGVNDDLTNNDNVFIGYLSGQLNTTGQSNVAVGFQALRSNTTGLNNTAMGYSALGSVSSGHSNTGLGFWALTNTTTGFANTALGVDALKENTSGTYNTAVGTYAGYNDATPANSNTTGSRNTFIGFYSGLASSTQRINATAIGYNAKVDASNAMVLGGIGVDAVNVGIATTNPLDKLHVEGSIRMVDGNQGASKVMVSDANGTASWASASTLSPNKIVDADNDTKIQVEESADEDIIRFDIAGSEYWRMEGPRLETGNTSNSVLIGDNAGLNDDLTNNKNIAIGRSALQSSVTGIQNVAIGDLTLSNATSSNNTAVGETTMQNHVTGDGNTAIGKSALFVNTGGENNTSLGMYSGYYNQGSGNVFLGHRAGQNETGSNRLYIDNSDTAAALIYGNFSTNEVAVHGELGVGVSTPTAPLHVAYTSGNGPVALVESGASQYPLSLRVAPSTHATSRRAVVAVDDWYLLQDYTGAGPKDFSIYQASTALHRFFINTAGNTGIGTFNPQSKLHVAGSIRMVDGNQAANKVMVSDANGTGSWTDLSSLAISTGTGSNGHVSYWTGTNSQAYDATGNFFWDATNDRLGIGTTTPGSQLEVQSAANGLAVVTIDQQGNDQYAGVNVQRDGTEEWFVGMNNTDNDFIIRGNTTSDFVTINNADGNVGIATTGPVAVLNVYEPDENATITTFTNNLGNSGMLLTTQYTAGAYTPGIFWNTTNDNSTKPKAGIFTQTTSTGSRLILSTSSSYATGINNSNNTLVLTEAANVGIGALSPSNSLSFNGDAVRTIGMERATTADGFSLTLQAGAAASGTSDNDGGNLILSGGITTGNGSINPGSNILFKTATPLGSSSSADQSPTEKMRISANGNVGVGTTAPSAKLSVNGGVITRGFAVHDMQYAEGPGTGSDNQYHNVVFSSLNAGMTGISIYSGNQFDGDIRINGTVLNGILNTANWGWYGVNAGATSAGSATNTDNQSDNTDHDCQCPDNYIATGIEIYAATYLDGRLKLRCTQLMSGLTTTETGLGTRSAFSFPYGTGQDDQTHCSMCPPGTYVKGIVIRATGSYLDGEMRVYCTGITD